MKPHRKKGFREEEKILEQLEKQEKLQLHSCSFAVKRLEEHGFIARSAKGFVPTEKGQYARQSGLKTYLECEEIEKEILEFSLERCKKRGLLLWTSFLAFLLFFLVFAAFNFHLFVEPAS